jgi:hypothetical protein
MKHDLFQELCDAIRFVVGRHDRDDAWTHVANLTARRGDACRQGMWRALPLSRPPAV